MQRDKASPDAANPAYQLSEYLGGDLPDGVHIWSKAGHNLWTGDTKTSWFKHDMIRWQAEGRKPLTIVLTTQGQGMTQTNPQAFPQIGRLIWDMTEDITRV